MGKVGREECGSDERRSGGRLCGVAMKCKEAVRVRAVQDRTELRHWRC